ncbi:unnamed protein product [Rotaria magnacalcarata]|uniref:MI domain-containing protein n=1 Tax=Rotaria magnacalcarata TaxID=392030 RepID=A0A814F686_9BILA|nr:unnamed protein product [Rotaria magnacalcarata]CAF1647498.1 unnamed protein product [Rotaria magnacalcarata]CAF4060404.1 unnamed protein product [Rotaria magnacalcarata]CAF4081725.1 unnamed protein product [Rotaria magnacalcarata]
MLKTEETGVASQTSNLYPTETTADVPVHTNGFPIPPAKRHRSQGTLTDILITEYQRLAWKDLRKTIKRQVKKLKNSNVQKVARELFKCNIIRGRGLLAKAIIKVQIKSPCFTPVYAALTSTVNSKFPQIGQLICKRAISSFRNAYMANKKTKCFAIAKFLAHLINQRALHEIIVLQILLLLFENRTDDNIMLAIELLKECGQKLLKVSPQELDSAFSVLDNFLHEPSLNKHTQDMIQELFTVRRDGFKTYSSIESSLDLIYTNDQYTHILLLDNSYDSEQWLNEFKYDEEYEVNEKKYKQSQKRVIKNSDDEDECSSNSSDSDEEDIDNEEKQQLRIINGNKTDFVTYHHEIYLIIKANIDAKECANKLDEMNTYHKRNKALCEMIVDICAQQHTYEDFFGLVGEHLCLSKEGYIKWFTDILIQRHIYADRLDNVKLRNIAKFFAHLLVTECVSWNVFDSVILTERNTSSSSIYLKNLFLELCQFLGFTELKNRLTDPTLTKLLQYRCLRDNLKNTRFCINFFTSIGLGRITDELQEFITNPLPVPSPRNSMDIYTQIVMRYRLN